MAKRVWASSCSGCGHRDGSDIGEATDALLALDAHGRRRRVRRAGCSRRRVVVDHLNGDAAPAKAPERAVLAEAARLARGPVVGWRAG